MGFAEPKEGECQDEFAAPIDGACGVGVSSSAASRPSLQRTKQPDEHDRRERPGGEDRCQHHYLEPTGLER